MNTGHVEEFVLPLEQKILDRLGITTGHVEFHQEEASYGFTGCDTCDPPEEGFSITVDGNQVWPTEEADGWTFMDDEGTYNPDTRTLTYNMSSGGFYEWLGATTNRKDTTVNTENLIDQLNTLIDQTPQDVLETAFETMDVRLADYKGRREDAKEILANLIQELVLARFEIKHKNFTNGQLEAAMFNITREIARVDEYTDSPAVIDYAERLARKIMYATKNTTPDTCEH